MDVVVEVINLYLHFQCLFHRIIKELSYFVFETSVELHICIDRNILSTWISLYRDFYCSLFLLCYSYTLIVGFRLDKFMFLLAMPGYLKLIKWRVWHWISRIIRYALFYVWNWYSYELTQYTMLYCHYRSLLFNPILSQISPLNIFWVLFECCQSSFL
jgi:hypothetical protein